MIYTRVRLYGEVKDLSMITSLAGRNVGEPVGADGRWDCDDPPPVHSDVTHPILNLTTKNATTAAQMNYDVQGVAHLSITGSSEMASHDLVVDIRRGLTTHFYATFVMSCSEDQAPLVTPDSDLIDQAIWELAQISLGVEECVIQAVVPERCYSNEVTEIAKGHAYAAASIADNTALIMIDESPCRKIVTITCSGHSNFSDESIWYKYWQCRAAYRELFLQASELSDRMTPLLDQASRIPVSHKSSKRLAQQSLEMRASITEATDMLRSFTLMSHTLQRFRDQLIFDKSVTAGGGSSPFKGQLLWDNILQEEQRLYIQPLGAVENAIEQLISSAESRLAGLEGIQQAAFNYQVQRQLRAMQAIAIIIAIIGLYATIR